jgi:hypothetical protein
MSLISEFYRGDPEAILRHCKVPGSNECLLEGVAGQLSLSTSGISSTDWLFASDLDDLADELAKRKGLPASGLRRYWEKLLDGDSSDDSESQIIVLTEEFVCDLSSLDDNDISQLTEQLTLKNNLEKHRIHEFAKALAAKPFRSLLDILALFIAPLFVWLISRSFLWTGIVCVALVYLAFVILPRRRLKKVESRSSKACEEKRPLAAHISKLVVFCQRAMQHHEKVVYEWSL